MGQRIKLSHPLIKTELSVTQTDADPNVWELSARGHNSLPFNAGSAEEAIKVGPTLVGGLRKTADYVEKVKNRAAKKAENKKNGTTPAKSQPAHGKGNK